MNLAKGLAAFLNSTTLDQYFLGILAGIRKLMPRIYER